MGAKLKATLEAVNETTEASNEAESNVRQAKSVKKKVSPLVKAEKDLSAKIKVAADELASAEAVYGKKVDKALKEFEDDILSV